MAAIRPPNYGNPATAKQGQRPGMMPSPSFGPQGTSAAPIGSGPGGWAMPGQSGVGPMGHATGYGGSMGPTTGWTTDENGVTTGRIRGIPNPPPLWQPPAIEGPGNGNPGGGPGGGIEEALNLWRRNMMPREAPVAEIPRIDDTEAVREAYARAKDTAGDHGRAALNSLMDLQGARGIVGSGLGVGEASGVISEGARQLGDFNREQAIQRVNNERERQFANYSGRLNQRGQDVTQRGQDMQLLPIIQSLFRLRY